ncbi:MAG: helicase-exonuclease AddAB subunit AddA [Lachnospiraceae bacterium]|nr:helicase-exonuclease AddAB subunit AddA [Lachnospiraceae bacterium]
MAVKFTKDQEKVILERNKNILVSAAAGSGKTAVLTERIIRLVSEGEDKCDIDRLLVVTFTSAAASEMRERIRTALNKKLEENPEDTHLQKQITLIHNAQITTIDSFCLYLIRNNFNDISLDPGFRVADEGEISLIKKETAQEVLEEAFEKADPSFLHCVECFSKPGREGMVMDYACSLYDFAMSYPFPLTWLEDCRKTYQGNSQEAFFESKMIIDLIATVRMQLFEYIGLLDTAIQHCREEGGPFQYEALLVKEREQLNDVVGHDDYKSLHQYFSTVVFDRLPSKKDAGVDPEVKELVKGVRDFVKKSIKSIGNEYFYTDQDTLYQDMKDSFRAVEQLIILACSFFYKFSKKKKDKNLIDFSDMEHLALSILLEEKEGTFTPTKTAIAYREYFKEVMTDEYQDSNLVQEFLLKSLSKEESGNHNRFMVGDVKQSIYKFRLARPELFMEKYKTYSKIENDNCVRIDLKQNFRSRNGILDTVNFVFYRIMTEALGGIGYDEDAALYPGANYQEYVSETSDQRSDIQNDYYKTEVILLETKADEDQQELQDDVPESDEQEEKPDKKEAEALVIAGKIKSMIGVYQVTDQQGGAFRSAEYKDMVILFRSNAGWDDVFKKVLESEGIPCYVASKSGYFSALEIQEVLHYLRMIDNPRQDISLCSVLRSTLFEFSDEELALIRGESGVMEKSFFEYLNTYQSIGQNTELKEKVSCFLSKLESYRQLALYTPIHELIYKIYYDEGYYYYVKALPGGEQRKANLDMLIEKAFAFEKTSFHGLFHFIRYMEQIEKYEVDYGEAGVLDENANVVRIMSIHKSKGLEFPICFLAGMAKQFNMQDMRKSMVYDLDYGIGADQIDPVKRYIVPTIRKKMIIHKMKQEMLGEELRILYVAMTRAKEKLILTGTISQYEKGLQNFSIFQQDECKRLPYTALTAAKSFLDLILAVIATSTDHRKIFLVQVLKMEDLVVKKMEELSNKADLKRGLGEEKAYDENLYESICKRFTYSYPFATHTAMITKTTVSELKKSDYRERILMAAEGETSVSEYYEEPEIIPYIPGFIKKEDTAGGIKKGNAYHRALELLDFTKAGSEEEIRSQINEFVNIKKLDQEEALFLSIQKLNDFMRTDLGKRMTEASKKGALKKEQPFMIGVNASRIKKDYPEEELVLVQGIIDAFFEEEGNLILVDYKSDYVTRAEELIDRYHLQFEYYAEALERLLDKKVTEKILYSIHLGQAIWLDF